MRGEEEGHGERGKKKMKRKEREEGEKRKKREVGGSVREKQKTKEDGCKKAGGGKGKLPGQD